MEKLKLALQWKFPLLEYHHLEKTLILILDMVVVVEYLFHIKKIWPILVD